MTDGSRVALISGGNRGIGREVGRQLAALGHRVVLGARDEAKGTKAAAKLGGSVETVPLDVTDQTSVEASVAAIVARHGRLDVLVNNAGVLPRGDLVSAPIDAFVEAMDVNCTGAVRLAREAVPHMKRGRYGRIVNVSSEMGRLRAIGSGQPAYRISKLALNAVTMALAAELGGAPIKVNSASPGWTRTAMGGRFAARSVAEGADTIVWLATLPGDGPTGGFYHDRKLIDW